MIKTVMQESRHLHMNKEPQEGGRDASKKKSFLTAFLNSDKTEILVLGTKSTLAQSDHFRLTTDNSIVSPSPQVKSLGVILASTLSYGGLRQ